MKVLGKRVLIKPRELKERTIGGIIIPDTLKTTLSEGTVLSVGEEISSLKEGDSVLFTKVGTEVDQDIIVSIDNVFAIINN